MTRLLLFALVASVALAGCAQNDDSPGSSTTPGTSTTSTSPGAPGTTTPAPATNDPDALFARAVDEMPEQFGMEMTITDNGTEMMRMRGAFDNATQTAYLNMSVDPAAFPEASTDDDAAALLREGFEMYVKEERVYYLIRGTAFVMGGSMPGAPVSGDAESSPFGDFLSPQDILGGAGEASDAEVTDVRAITHRGRPAMQMTVTAPDEDDGTTTSKVIVYTSPARIARMETTLVPDEDEADDPFARGTMVADFLYDDEVTFEVPPGADRAFGLAYTSDAMQRMYDFSEGPKTITWNFTGDGGIALSEIELHVKGEMEDPSDVDGYTSAPTLWSMGLAEGSKTQDGVTLTYHDNDDDGKVSPGDAVTILYEGTAPTVVLYDTTAGVYVVPGAALVWGLAALGAVALLLRRK